MILLIIIGSIFVSVVTSNKQIERARQDQEEAESQAAALMQAKASAKKFFESDIEGHYTKLQEFCSAGSHADAVALLNKFYEYGLQSYKDVEALNASARTAMAEKQLADLPVDDIANRLAAYAILARFHPEHHEYADEQKKLQAQLDDQQRKRAEAEARIKRIESKFLFDGSLPALVRKVKEDMKNPASFEHVKTMVFDKGDHLLVKMTYRGTNSFNAIMTTTAVATVDLDGHVLAMVAE